MANGAKAFETGTRSALTEFLSKIAPKMLQDTLQYDRQQELFERELEEKKRVSNEENDKFMLGQFMKISNIDQRKAAINAYNPSSELGEKQHIAFKDVVETSADRLADANAFLKGYQNMIGEKAENFVYKGVKYDRDSGLHELEVRLGNSVEPQIKGMYQNYLTSTNIKDKITNQNLATVFKSFLPEEAGTAIDKLAQQSNMSSDRFSQTVNVLISTNQDAKTATIRFFNTEQGQDVLQSLSDENKRAMLKDLDLLDDSVVFDDGDTDDEKDKSTGTFLGFGKRDGTTTNLSNFSSTKKYFEKMKKPFNEETFIKYANVMTTTPKDEIIKEDNLDEDTYNVLLKEAEAFLKLDEDVSGVDVNLTAGKGVGLSFEARNPDEQITGLELQPGRGGMPGIGLKTVNKQVQSLENALSKLNVDLNISGKKGKAGNTISISPGDNPLEQRSILIGLRQALSDVRENKLKNQNETLIASKTIPLLIQRIEQEFQKEQPQEIEVNILELIKQANIQ